jgi:hypothetical protein
MPADGEIRKGRVIVISEIKALLMTPLVGRNPLHGDVLIRPGITELECTVTDIHQRRTPFFEDLRKSEPKK